MKTRDLKPCLLLLLLAAGFLQACGESEYVGLYDKGQAEKIARKAIEAWGAGMASDVAALCGQDLRFGIQNWRGEKQVRENLDFQVARRRPEAERFDTFEVFSWGDLDAGRWPRGRQVPEDERKKEITALGVQRDGFLVRASCEGARGWQLIINPDPTKGGLTLQAVLP